MELGDNDRPVVYVYELDQSTHAYGLVGVRRERPKLSSPFAIDIDLTEMNRS